MKYLVCLVILVFLIVPMALASDTLLVYPDVSGYAAQTTDGTYASMRGGAGQTGGNYTQTISPHEAP